MKKFLSLMFLAFISVFAFAQSVEISELVVGNTSLELEADKTYTLNAKAVLSTDVVKINGNGATIKVGEAGKFSVQKGIILDNVVLDGTATANAIVELSANPDASLATYIDATGTEGEEGYVPASMKYANATWKGYEAQEITIKNSKVMTANSLIRPAAAWALRALNIDNTIVEVKYKSGKAIINMEENGAGVIQDIKIKNSTIYADDAATEMRFHRYAAQNDPWRVWGYEGEDKNVTKDTWTLENNTFVGVCGNKEFSNNMKNTNATEFTFKNNAFINTWRINKLGSNCKRNFEQADNVIMGGTNAVDGTDANWFTAVDDLGAVWNFETAPAATDVEALGAAFGLYVDYATFGDPRWAANAKEYPTEISEMVVGKTTLNLKKDIAYTLNANAVLGLDVVTINGNGATITVGEAGKFSVQKGIILDNVVLDGTATANAIVELSANPDASLATYTDAIGTEGEEGYVPASMKYANASWKGYEAQEITIKNSTIITNNSLIRPAKAWAIRALNIDNTIVEVKYKSGKAIINMEENGAGVIQDINIKNSTFYADDAATEMRFHRYAAQNDPWRVWGYEGEDKNVTKDTWTLENNTFVGVCGNKEFSNNMKNTNATEFTFKNNAFINTWRINKLGGNCKRNFEQADNVIMGGTNAVDGTDANWFTAVDDLGAVWNFTEGAPVATDMDALGAAFGLYEECAAFGDPRWAEYSKVKVIPVVLDVVTPDVSDSEIWNIYENEDYKIYFDITKNLPLDPARTYTLEDMDAAYSYIYSKNEIVTNQFGTKEWKKYAFTSASVKIGANNELEAVVEAVNGEDVISGTFVFNNPDPITVTLEGETEYIADMNVYAVSAKNLGSELKADYIVQFGIKADAYESKTTFTADDLMAAGNTIRVATKEAKIASADITLTVGAESQTYEGTVVDADGKTYAICVTTNIPTKEAKKDQVDFGAVLEVSEDEGDIKLVAVIEDVKFVGYITVNPVTTDVPSGEYNLLSYTKFGPNSDFGYMLDAVEDGKVTVTNARGTISIVATFKQNNVEYTITASTPSSTGIADAINNAAATRVVKAINNGKIIIVKGEKTYNAAGQLMK